MIKQKKRLRQSGVLVSLVGFFVSLGLVLFVAHKPDEANNYSVSSVAGEALLVREQARTIYPYSVVPGGTFTPAELRLASTNDPVVANHYQSYNHNASRLITSTEPQRVHVSYRMGDEIFWTKEKVLLPAGELLITDGDVTARTRCANQISVTAREPVSDNEPPLHLIEDPFRDSAHVQPRSPDEVTLAPLLLASIGDAPVPIPGDDSVPLSTEPTTTTVLDEKKLSEIVKSLSSGGNIGDSGQAFAPLPVSNRPVDDVSRSSCCEPRQSPFNPVVYILPRQQSEASPSEFRPVSASSPLPGYVASVPLPSPLVFVVVGLILIVVGKFCRTCRV